MTSPAQLAANRANSQKSTGPRTPEGKAQVRRNAFRHGLQSVTLAFNEEDEIKFNACVDDLLAELHPVGPTEELVFCKLVEQYWLSRRGAARLTAQTRLPDPDQHAAQITLILRYNTTATNGFYRALRELDRLQAKRKKNPQPQPQTQPEPVDEIGFVPQNATPADPEPIPTPQPAPDPGEPTQKAA